MIFACLCTFKINKNESPKHHNLKISNPPNVFAYFFERSKFANILLLTGAMFFFSITSAELLKVTQFLTSKLDLDKQSYTFFTIFNTLGAPNGSKTSRKTKHLGIQYNTFTLKHLNCTTVQCFLLLLRLLWSRDHHFIKNIPVF